MVIQQEVGPILEVRERKPEDENFDETMLPEEQESASTNQWYQENRNQIKNCNKSMVPGEQEPDQELDQINGTRRTGTRSRTNIAEER